MPNAGTAGMTEALDRLIEAVEGGNLDSVNRVLGALFAADHSLPWIMISNVNSAFRGSLDAAKALHEALFGAAHWSLAEDDDYGFCGRVYLGGWFHEHSTVAARAWLLAILKAYRVQIGGAG